MFYNNSRYKIKNLKRKWKMSDKNFSICFVLSYWPNWGEVGINSSWCSSQDYQLDHDYRLQKTNHLCNLSSRHVTTSSCVHSSRNNNKSEFYKWQKMWYMLVQTYKTSYRHHCTLNWHTEVISFLMQTNANPKLQDSRF